MRQNWIASVATAVSLVIGGGALAKEWQAIVIGQSGPEAPRAFADAFYANEALQAGGLEVLHMLRDAPHRTVINAFEDFDKDAGALVYLAGPLLTDGDGIRAGGVDLRFEDVVEQVAAVGVKDVAILIENCPAQTNGLEIPALDPALSVLWATSAAPGEDCPATDARMTDLLRNELQVEASLAEILRDGWVQSFLSEPVILQPAQAKPAPVVSIIDSSVNVLAPVGVPASDTVLTPVSRDNVNLLELGSLEVFTPVSPDQVGARAIAPGLPRPSIIVGFVEQPTLASFSPAAASGAVTSTEIRFDNLAARQAMRAQDAGVFNALVQDGVFDPAEVALPAALQTELARMGCYTGAIDGLWGAGSRAAVSRYFEQTAGVSAVSLDAVPELFRQIVTQDDVTCSVVAQAAATPRANAAPARVNTQRRTTTRAAPRRQPQQPAPATRTISNSNRLGVFR